jgi:EAL and modified HD-GYP domain-containing signal transduction protein
MQKNDVLLARQPIYDRNKTLHGYELLFRNSVQNKAEITCNDVATSSVLLNAFTETDFEEVTNNLPAFVNFSAELLEQPPFFDPENVVIEILEDVDINKKVIERILQLRKEGYVIALDDYALEPKYKPLLPHIDIVKVDLPATPPNKLQQVVSYLRQFKLTLLAEKVETPEEFKLCHELGFDLFQGYFLARPEIVKGRKMETSELSVLHLIAEVQNPDTDIEKLVEVISRDPMLSFKLLKLVNSAAFRRSKEIESIKNAVLVLGLNRVKGWASLLALSKLSNKPEALQETAFIRALACEKIAERLSPNLRDSFYTVGLLSSLDAFFNQPLETILKELPIDDTLKKALTQHEGLPGLALNTTLNFEQSKLDSIDWDKLASMNLTPSDINSIYYQASGLAQSA